jgi:glutamate 5-kinase
MIMGNTELLESATERISGAKRVVFKVGTSTIVYPETGKPNYRNIELLARIIANIQNQGKEVILVSSGAIGVGRDKLRGAKAVTIPEKQAVAAVGQCELMFQYSRFFGEYGKVVGQILLTLDVYENSERRKNVINTFRKLLEKEIIPIVNENDSVSVDEIKIGDNDTLSALVAILADADLLIVISDIDGLYDCDPRTNDCAKKISYVEKITSEIESYAGDKGSDNATGGMKTKIEAAKMVTAAGIDMILTSGLDLEEIYEVLEGKPKGTVFLRQ